MATLSDTTITSNLTVSKNVTTNVVILNCAIEGATPPKPTSNQVGIYSLNVANTPLEFTTSPIANNALTSTDAVRQHGLMYKSIFWMKPSMAMQTSNTTGFTFMGVTGNVVCNVNQCLSNIQPTNAVPILLNSTSRTVLCANNTLATGNAGIIANSNLVWGCGSTGNGGGYLGVIRFAKVSSGITSQNLFAGFANLIALPTAQTDWAANTTYSTIGIAANGGANLKFICGSYGNNRTITDLGTNFNYNTTDMIELTVYVAPGGAGGGYRVRNLSNGAEVQAAITTNLPLANQFMQPMVQVFTGTAVVANVAIMNIYVEEDF